MDLGFRWEQTAGSEGTGRGAAVVEKMVGPSSTDFNTLLHNIGWVHVGRFRTRATHAVGTGGNKRFDLQVQVGVTIHSHKGFSFSCSRIVVVKFCLCLNDILQHTLLYCIIIIIIFV